jgi:hypothetical protein
LTICQKFQPEKSYVLSIIQDRRFCRKFKGFAHRQGKWISVTVQEGLHITGSGKLKFQSAFYRSTSVPGHAQRYTEIAGEEMPKMKSMICTFAHLNVQANGNVMQCP